jgi:hypothetical protein
MNILATPATRNVAFIYAAKVQMTWHHHICIQIATVIAKSDETV